LRVREQHAAVLRRADTATAEALTATDALDDATVLIVGRGLLSQEIASVLGRVKSVVALSVEGAAKQLNGRDIDGVIVGDGLSPLMIDAFLAALADDTQFPRRCRTSTPSKPSRTASSPACGRWCACTPSARGSPARWRRSTPAASSIRIPG